MLNDIKFHINSNEHAQQLAEQSLIDTINLRFTRNKEALIRYVPSIGQKIENIKLAHFSVFIDKNKQLNIVDFNTGRTLYTLFSDENIEHQMSSWASNSALLSLPNSMKLQSNFDANVNSVSSPNIQDLSAEQKTMGHSFEQLQQYAINLERLQTSNPIDTFVALGLGKASFLERLLTLHSKLPKTDSCKLNLSNLKYLVCYEPNWEWFISSLYSFDWAKLLTYFHQHGLTLFLQVGTEINLIHKDIDELHVKLNASQILFYKHMNLPVYNNVIRNVRNARWNPNVTMADKLELESQHDLHYIQPFSSLRFSDWNLAQTQYTTFKNNLNILKEFYPDIHSAFIEYTPKCWQTIVNHKNGEINLYNRYSSSYFNSQNARQLLGEQADYYVQNPSHDGLVLGYSSDKLKHYLHNSFIRQCDFILRNDSSKHEELPQDVKVMMVLGLGDGQLFEKIRSIREIQHLVVCEPNHDMFYASLFVVDWVKIIEQADKNEYHLYINIGESSNRLFKDVMSQFMQIGPHLLNETYILQSYENPLLSKMYYEVRQQLQVLFALGENFDHVAYGIAHTIQALTNDIPAMRFEPSQYLTHKHKQIPIFIVGNGPSLDENIEILKECREQVIVVSCGTALQALHRNGITPDFHGEVEQNRANFDWVSRIGDFDYLKKITLISVNGIHPDTIKLFKNTLFAFKAGESSTHTAVSLYPQESFHIIEYAYPTVTNMALSFFLALGFEQIYLVGVDLGFASKTKHHSQSSGYYEKGKQIYDYEQQHAVDLQVRGNRQPWVFTKTEFNISRMLIEQLLQDSEHGLAKKSECFNLSNGVMIEGTTPLEPDSVLILNDSNDQKEALKQIEASFTISNIDARKRLTEAYSHELFNLQQQEIKTALPETFSSKKEIQDLISGQTKLLTQARGKGGSLFYYYYVNTVNASNALFTKAKLIKSESLALTKAQKILEAYRVFLDDAKNMVDNYLTLIDVAGAFIEKREAVLIDINHTIPSCHLNQSNLPKRSSNLELPILIHVTLIVENIPKLETFQKMLSNDQYKYIQLQKFTQSFDGLDWVDAHSDMSTMTILAMLVENELSVSTYSEWLSNFVTSHVKPSNEAKLNVTLVFSDFELLNTFTESFKELTAVLNMQFIPPSCSLMDENTSKRFELGVQSGMEDSLWLSTLVLRSQNFYLFDVIINKPRFLKTGLKCAVAICAESNELTKRNIDDNHATDKNDVSSKGSSQQKVEKTNDDNSRGTNLQSENADFAISIAEKDSVTTDNEYVCKAVEHIQDRFMSKSIWTVPSEQYMFKHHVGMIFEQTTNAVRPITQLDKTNNRGLKLSRKPFAFELLGPWIDG